MKDSFTDDKVKRRHGLDKTKLYNIFIDLLIDVTLFAIILALALWAINKVAGF